MSDSLLPSHSMVNKASQTFLRPFDSGDELSGEIRVYRTQSKSNNRSTKILSSARSLAREESSSKSELDQKPRGLKRKAHNPSSTLNEADLESLSSLTSLSSDSELEASVRSVRLVTPATSPSKSKATRSNLTSSLHSSPAKTNTRTSHSRSRDSWSLSQCASLVFVLIDSQGQAVDDRLDVPEPMMWWPGKVANVSPHSVPLCITMYNQFTSTSSRIVKLQFPSPFNLQPMHQSRGAVRFNESTFLAQSHPPSPTRSSSKRVRRDPRERPDSYTVEKWKEALAQMKKDYEDEGDDDISSNRGQEGPEDEEPTSPMVGPSASSSFVPPPPDPTLEIPGELLLAREKADSLTHWPAKLLAYVQPQRKNQRPKYQVEFLDKSIKTIPRDWFFTSEQEGFATCKIGQWESSYREESGSESEPDDIHDDINDARNDRFLNSVPAIPPPSPSEFSRLPVAHQFAYVKPVLLAILNEEYTPARQRHDDFLKGGKYRAAVRRDVTMRGIIPGEEVGKFAECLRAWTLGGTSKAGVGDKEELLVRNHTGDGDVNHEDHDARPASSPDYPETTFSPSPASAPPSSLPVIEPRSPSPSIGQDKNIPQVEPQHEDESSAISNAHDFSVNPNAQHRDLARVESGVFSTHPQGRAAYEALSELEKLDYVLNVLHYELILQIILWRTGKRRQSNLLSPAEEQALRDSAQEESLTTDWVFDVTRLRASKHRLMKARKSMQGKDVVVGGTRSRPKTAANGHRHV